MTTTSEPEVIEYVMKKSIKLPKFLQPGPLVLVLLILGLIPLMVIWSILENKSEHQEHERRQSEERSIAQATQSAPKNAVGSNVVLTLEPGVWHDLRAEGVLLPYRNFNWNNFDCVEIIYDNDPPHIVCEDGVKPEIPASPGAIDSGDYYFKNSPSHQIKVRSLVNRPTKFIVVQSP